eukprot:TRINITY_DN136417_c0_g1_i1.p1 TRINITY_DN136417_c0_g1~~TRINITY_DN136417_c0_g1_i1.p1  ORF type:complete len:126 (+),score=52.66 TRINITY_DN136417_c0_g1_i1:59-436(+)
MSTTRVKAYELRNKKKAELVEQLGKLKNELAQLRVAKVTGGAPSKLAKIRTVRHSIARVMTVINQTQRQQLQLHWKGKKYKPLDLRPKLTRALRRQLKDSEKNAVTLRQRKQQIHFPQRRFAVKA